MNILKKITSVLLAMIFLVSSMGFTVNKMVCIKSGKTKISFSALKDCCREKKSGTPVLKNKCCDITNSSFNLESFERPEKIKVANTFVLQPAFINNTTIDYSNSACAAEIISFADIPPPLYGRKLLSFISILII